MKRSKKLKERVAFNLKLFGGKFSYSRQTEITMEDDPKINRPRLLVFFKPVLNLLVLLVCII